MIPDLHHGTRILRIQPKLLAHATEFYKDLYSAPPKTQSLKDMQKTCLQSVPRVQKKQNERLTPPLTELELMQVVCHLPLGKSPGPNSIPNKCFKELWEDIKNDSLPFCHNVMDQGSLPAILNTGKVVLIPKLGDRQLLQNF